MKRTLEERLKEVENEVAQIKKENSKTKFYGKKIGDTFEFISIPWKVLDITEKGYACLAMETVIENKEFGTGGNNWRDSNLREWIHKSILPKIKEEVGEDKVIKFKRNLISLDALAEYGECLDEISLISVDEYRKYRNLIPNSKNEWWWTITPCQQKVMMTMLGLPLFPRRAISTTTITTTVTGSAHSVLQTVGVGKKPKPEKIQKGVRPFRNG